MPRGPRVGCCLFWGETGLPLSPACWCCSLPLVLGPAGCTAWLRLHRGREEGAGTLGELPRGGIVQAHGAVRTHTRPRGCRPLSHACTVVQSPPSPLHTQGFACFGPPSPLAKAPPRMPPALSHFPASPNPSLRGFSLLQSHPAPRALLHQHGPGTHGAVAACRGAGSGATGWGARGGEHPELGPGTPRCLVARPRTGTQWHNLVGRCLRNQQEAGKLGFGAGGAALPRCGTPVIFVSVSSTLLPRGLAGLCLSQHRTSRTSSPQPPCRTWAQDPGTSWPGEPGPTWAVARLRAAPFPTVPCPPGPAVLQLEPGRDAAGCAAPSPALPAPPKQPLSKGWSSKILTRAPSVYHTVNLGFQQLYDAAGRWERTKRSSSHSDTACVCQCPQRSLCARARGAARGRHPPASTPPKPQIGS